MIVGASLLRRSEASPRRDQRDETEAATTGRYAWVAPIASITRRTFALAQARHPPQSAFVDQASDNKRAVRRRTG